MNKFMIYDLRFTICRRATALLALLVTCHLSLVTCSAGNAVVTILDASQNPLTGVRCIVSAQNFPQPASTGVAVQWRNGGYTTDNTGSFTIPNAVPSNYHVAPVGMNFLPFDFTMPATNGTIHVQNNLWFTPPPNLGTNYPTFSQGDLRWGKSGAATNVNNATGTNVDFSGVFTGDGSQLNNGNATYFFGGGTVPMVNLPANLLVTNGNGSALTGLTATQVSGVLTNGSPDVNFTGYFSINNPNPNPDLDLDINHFTGYGAAARIGNSSGTGLEIQVGDILTAGNLYGSGGWYYLDADGGSSSYVGGYGGFFGVGTRSPGCALDVVGTGRATALVSSSGVITNAGLVWYSLKTNGVPNLAAPSGSICTTTNGQFFVRSNSVWLLK